MPNIHFFAAPADLVDVVGLAFEVGWEVYEEYSAYDRPLRRFQTVASSAVSTNGRLRNRSSVAARRDAYR